MVDDDKEITELLSDYLTKNDYKVTSALSGKNINRLLKENNFDFAVLDIMMPIEWQAWKLVLMIILPNHSVLGSY